MADLFRTAAVLVLTGLAAAAAHAQDAPRAALPPLPAPLGVPKPGPATDAPYAPQPILPGGVVIAAVPARLAVPQRGARPRARAIQHEPDGAGAHQQHRQHPQPVDRSTHGGSRHQHRRGGDPGGGRRAQHAERGLRGRRLRSLLLQLRRQHRHPAEPAAARRIQPADGRGERCAAGDPPGARLREGVEHRSEQDRHHGLLGRRGTGRAGGGAVRRVRQEEQRRRRSAGGNFLAARTSWGSSIPARRPSRATARRRRFRATCRRPSWSAAGRATGSTRSGRSSIFRDAGQGRAEHRDAHLRQWAAIPATRCPTAAT